MKYNILCLLIVLAFAFGICIAKYDMQHVMYCVSVGLFSL